MDDKDIQASFTSLLAYAAALEDVLVAVVNSLPNRAEALKRVRQEGGSFDSLALAHPFSEDALEQFQEARHRLLALIDASSSQS